jgi:hypothetical protein
MLNRVYEFWYNNCIYEGSPSCISLHRTKEGAESAMLSHKCEAIEKWEKMNRWKKERGVREREVFA